MSIVVHGDDFTALGESADLDWYERALAEFFELKLRARVGPEEKDDKEVRILNRVLRLQDTGLLYESTMEACDTGHQGGARRWAAVRGVGHGAADKIGEVKEKEYGEDLKVLV